MATWLSDKISGYRGCDTALAAKVTLRTTQHHLHLRCSHQSCSRCRRSSHGVSSRCPTSFRLWTKRKSAVVLVPRRRLGTSVVTRSLQTKTPLNQPPSQSRVNQGRHTTSRASLHFKGAAMEAKHLKMA